MVAAGYPPLRDLLGGVGEIAGGYSGRLDRRFTSTWTTRPGVTKTAG
jgi:hypothetical protein